MREYIEDKRSMVLYELNKNNILQRFDCLAFIKNYRLKIKRRFMLITKMVMMILLEY